MITLKGNNAGYEGDSNDVKPTDVPVNTIFRELDTNCKYYFTGEAWVEIPGGGGGGGGGTDSYNDLENKPQINSVTLSGNKSLSALGIQAELTIDSAPTEDSTNPVESGGVYEALALKQDTLTIDSTPTESSTNPVESGGVYTALGNKQDTLTFNGTYNASTNPAATVSTVTGEISTAVGNLTKSDVGLDNVTNNAQIKAISGAVTSGDIVTFGGDGATVQDSGKAIETALTDSDNKIPTSKSIIDNAAGAEKLTGYSADSAEANITASTTVTGAIEQLDYRTTLNKNNISYYQANGSYNKLRNSAITQTISGTTFSVNTDGTVDISGKPSSGYAQIVISDLSELENGKQYTFYNGGTVQESTNIYFGLLGASGVPNLIIPPNGVTITLDKSQYLSAIIRVTSSSPITTANFKPMATEGTITHSYEQYALSNAELTAKEQTNENNISSLNQYAGGKNKFNIDSATINASDASYTKNSDGTINVTKSTNTIGQVNMQQAFLGETGTYIISGCPSGGSSTTYEMLIQSGNTVLARDYGEGASVSLTKGTEYQFKVVIRESQALSNKLFKPMISIEGGEYQPYAMSNVELTEKHNQLGTILYARYLSDLTFTKSLGGLYYSNDIDISTDFDEVFSAGLANFSNVPNIAINTMLKENKSICVVVCDPTSPASLSFSEGSITIRVFGRKK